MFLAYQTQKEWNSNNVAAMILNFENNNLGEKNVFRDSN